MEKVQIDVKENAINSLSPKILGYLLKDKTTGNNIMWATDDYAIYGDGYSNSDFITIESITGENGNIIKPRTEKTKEEQSARSKDKAEVFTPSWVCNKQNNLVDNAWFGYENAFNEETDNGWIVNKNKVVFPDTKKKTWQDYVKANRLEISCGEAPYLASRYDAVTGDYIPVAERIGLLDRKLRVVSENTDNEADWIYWATKAVKSIYGFDWQGDNVLLARENILFSFAEHYENRFKTPAKTEYLIKIAKVTAWNIWQMDGIKFVVPNSCHDVGDQVVMDMDGSFKQNITKCPGCEKNDQSQHNGIYCRIYDWPANRSVEFYSFIKKGARNYGSKI